MPPSNSSDARGSQWGRWTGPFAGGEGPIRTDDAGDDGRRARLQARISRAIEFVGVGIATVVPLVFLIVAVETRSPGAGVAGLFLAAVAALLIANR